MSNQKLNLGLFLLAMIVGAALTVRSWDGVIYVYVGDGDERSPAAVSKVIDFSHLEGSAFSLASQKRLLSEANILKKDDFVGVELGHFVAKGPSGKRRFACHLYDRIELKFVAEGVAESGEQPVMYVEAKCEIGKSVGKIAPIWIPVAKLNQEKPSNMELMLNEPQQLLFRFDHIGSHWPQQWALKGLTMFSNNSDRRITIKESELREIKEKPLRLVWSSDRTTASESE